MPPDHPRPAALPTRMLGPQDDGHTCLLRVGQSACLQLPEVPTSGYRWQWVGGAPGAQVLRLVDDAYQRPGGPPGGLGGQGLRAWHFQAEAVGEQRLQLQLARAGGASALERFSCVLRVHAAG